MNPRPAPQRTFTLVDLVILGTATAAGFAIFRALRIDLPIHDRPLGESWPSRIADQGLLALVPFLITWTLAFPLIRLRSPRRPFRRLVRQPGMAGCLAAAAAILYEFGWYALVARVRGLQIAIGTGHLPNFGPFLRFYGDLVSLWVAAAWMVLALGRWWRPERGWVDSLGRLLCLAWFVMKLIEIAFYHVP